jgi:hypothetical protein
LGKDAGSDGLETLAEKLKASCEKILSPLILPHGFVGPRMEDSTLYANAFYLGEKTAIRIEAELRDEAIFAALVRLIDGKIPEARAVKGQTTFKYITTILSRVPGRSPSFEEALANYRDKNPLSVSADWVEKGVWNEAYLFSEYPQYVFRDTEDILEDKVEKGNFKF